MARFISFPVVGNASQYKNCDHLVNVDDILNVLQSADQTVVILVKGTTAGDDVITLSASTSSSAQANPVSAAGAPLTTSINYAITANPGGVKARVSLPVDDNGAQMYWSNIVVS
jgi:hypothetical protein|tara:strand:- start:362 stop:703 length:342 start_codon:yes stop_codon:yes gene_type:complete